METLVIKTHRPLRYYALSDTNARAILLSLRRTGAYPSDLAEQIGVFARSCRTIWRVCAAAASWSRVTRADVRGTSCPTRASRTPSIDLLGLVLASTPRAAGTRMQLLMSSDLGMPGLDHRSPMTAPTTFAPHPPLRRSDDHLQRHRGDHRPRRRHTGLVDRPSSDSASTR